METQKKSRSLFLQCSIPEWALPMILSYCGYPPHLTEYQRVYLALKRWWFRLRTGPSCKSERASENRLLNIFYKHSNKLNADTLSSIESVWFQRQNFLWNPKWRRWEYVLENKRVLQIHSGLLENILFDANWVRKKAHSKMKRPLVKANEVIRDRLSAYHLDSESQVDYVDVCTNLFKQGSLILKYHSEESNQIVI